jgi:hypothetical protein
VREADASRGTEARSQAGAVVGDTVTNKLAGHFRIGPSGIEFATGYDDSTIPRSIV